MPRGPYLPQFDSTTGVNQAPHVVILGAGASLAAFPVGDKYGRQLPLMNDLPETLNLSDLLDKHKLNRKINDFESFFSDLASDNKYVDLIIEIERRTLDYFASMEIPDMITMYDLLILSLREKDVIATFNWDPLLAQAYRRNTRAKNLPSVVFLHGNAGIGICEEDGRYGYLTDCCQLCRQPLKPSRLLFPVSQKDYQSDSFTRSQWNSLQQYLSQAYLITIFGYRAPATDVEAKELLRSTWKHNPSHELGQVEIVNIDDRASLEATWKEFFVGQHYHIIDNIHQSMSFQHVRRSCDAFAMTTLMQRPWEDNPFPRLERLESIHQWLYPLLAEEEDKLFSGRAYR